MIVLKQKKDCCGCSACVQKCPQHCITMKNDVEGFLYPEIYTNNCINCDVCVKVCPVINIGNERTPIGIYAAKNNCENIRLESSSGGIFTLIAEKVIEEGGVVFGAKFDENWRVKHDYCENKDGLKVFRGSKYVQSYIGISYKQVHSFLESGRKVLFSGTPCQISGLNLFLKKEYVNLLTVEVICHGVPSPEVWKRYLSEEIIRHSKEINAIDLKITNINFRDKKNGWQNFNFLITFKQKNKKGKEKANNFIRMHRNNLFMKGFLQHLYLRPSCHYCPAKSFKSGADISLGDFWSIKEIDEFFFDDKGISLVFINTQKGDNVYNIIESSSTKVSYEESLTASTMINKSSSYNEQRDIFFNLYNKKGLLELLYDLTKKKKKTSVLIFFKNLILKIKRCI